MIYWGKGNSLKRYSANFSVGRSQSGRIPACVEWRLSYVYCAKNITDVNKAGYPNFGNWTRLKQMHVVLLLCRPLPNVGKQNFDKWVMYDSAKAYRSIKKSIANRWIEDWKASNGHTKDTTRLFHGPWHDPVGEHVCAQPFRMWNRLRFHPLLQASQIQRNPSGKARNVSIKLQNLVHFHASFFTNHVYFTPHDRPPLLKGHHLGWPL